jgi:hypothetical protein
MHIGRRTPALGRTVDDTEVRLVCSSERFHLLFQGCIIVGWTAFRRD